MLKDMQHIFQAIEDKLGSLEEKLRLSELMQNCYQEQCKQKEETIKVKEAQLEDAQKQIAALEQALSEYHEVLRKG